MFDFAVLGMTRPERGGFYGLPWFMALAGGDGVAGPTVSQACATSARALQTALDMLGGDVQPAAQGPVIATYSRAVLRSRSSGVLQRRMPDDAAATAQQLFAVLRGFDDQGVKLIWIETLPDGLEWDGVRDRLQRAAAAA